MFLLMIIFEGPINDLFSSSSLNGFTNDRIDGSNAKALRRQIQIEISNFFDYFNKKNSTSYLIVIVLIFGLLRK